MGEKRRAPRVSWFVEGKIFCVDQDLHWNVRLTDISEGGCFVDTIVPLASGTRVLVKINDGNTRLEIPGNVLYDQTGIGSAIQFEPLEPTLHSQVLKIIESKAAETSI